MKNNRDQKDKSIKVVIFGATGNTGTQLLRAGLSQGYEVTAFVRNREKLMMQLGSLIPDNLHIIVGDVLDEKAVGDAIKGHNTVVNVAAHVRDMQYFHNICKVVVHQADKYLDNPKRLWLFGGIPALDFPRTNTMGLDLPFFPSVFKVHRDNYELLKNSNTDWSFMCPGPMMPAQSLDQKESVHISTEVMPFEVKPWLRYLPKAFCSLTFKNRISECVVSYEAVADFVMKNLEAKGPYYKKRVGIANKERSIKNL